MPSPRIAPLLLLVLPVVVLADARSYGTSALDGEHAWRLDFDRNGARVVASGQEDGWTSSLHLTGMHRDDRATALAESEPLGLRGGAFYTRGSVSEWYATTPAGLEQGFTIDAPPAGAGRITLDVTIGGGLHVHPSPLPDRVELRDAGGRVVLLYGELHAIDARGRALGVSLEASGSASDRVALHVDDTGAEYPVMIDPLLWRQVDRLTASDLQANDYFGSAVSVFGDAGFVGAGHQGRPDGGGGVYAYARSGAGFTEVAQLTNGLRSDQFGGALAAGPDMAIIGAPGANGDGGLGAAYAFSRDGGAWSKQQLVTTSAAPSLGGAVALSGDTAVVGANVAPGGGAFVFRRSAAGVWAQESALVPTSDALAQDDGFSSSLAIDGDTIAVAAPLHETGSGRGGAVYVFARSGTTWTEQARLSVPGVVGDYFGTGLGLSGGTILVGRRGVSGSTGVTYVYTRSGQVWTQAATSLKAADETPNNLFGAILALDGSRAVIGAPGATAIYAFTRDAAGVWGDQVRLKPTDVTSAENFGSSLSLSGDTAFVGAPWKTVTSDAGAFGYAGAAYVYRFAVPEGEACSTTNACLSGFCVDGVCCDSACGGGDTHDCQACSVTAGAAKNGACGPAAATFVCRSAVGECDAPESCDGVNTSCPGDGTRPNATACSGGACVGGKCVAAANDAGLDSGGEVPDAGGGGDDSGGCSIARAPSRGSQGIVGLVIASLVVLVRRRSRREKAKGAS